AKNAVTKRIEILLADEVLITLRRVDENCNESLRKKWSLPCGRDLCGRANVLGELQPQPRLTRRWQYWRCAPCQRRLPRRCNRCRRRRCTRSCRQASRRARTSMGPCGRCRLSGTKHCARQTE